MEEEKLIKKKTKAIRDNNPMAIIAASIGLAEYCFREEKYDRAIDEYKFVAKQYKIMNNVMDYARCHRMIGEAYMHMQNYDKALEHQQVHLQISKQEKDKVEEQRALATIGHIYLTNYLDKGDESDKNSLNLAYKSFMKSLVVCESLTGINKREHMDMSCRLFANLGVVQESLGNYDKGIELVQKSVGICKTHDIYDQLQRGYSYLGSLYAKKEDFSNAIHQYNLAYDVAERLENKTQLICAALLSKAELLIKLTDFHAAKGILLKAYKLNSPISADRQHIEYTLKTVAALCNTEDQLLTMSETDHKSRKKLYERMGDGACELKIYAKAIEYYQKMLQEAQQNGETGQNLSPCYVSLAQTYSDNKQYDLAIKYFEKDFSVNQTCTREAINTLFTITDVMESAGKDFREIECIYEKAREICKRANDSHLEGKVLSRHKILLEQNFEENGSEKLKSQIQQLHYVSSDSEIEQDEPLKTPTIGDHVDIDDITDISDDDEKCEEKKSRGSRKRQKTFLIKRNAKGETQLHIACISGKYTLVLKLLDQGHAVNVRDNCGWLPIHEACNFGQLDIVTLLIDRGAAINDRGGKNCEGVTPLHDAALNGHLDVVDLLLDRGANAVAKTDKGETPLHLLQKWRQSEELRNINQAHYESILERLTTALEKSGQNIVAPAKNTLIDEDEEEIYTEPITQQKSIGNLRRFNGLDTESDDSNDDSSTANVKNAAKGEYMKVMQNLRHKLPEKSNFEQKLSKRSALLYAEDMVEDWLDDDLRLCSSAKKRRTTLPIKQLSSPIKNANFDKENFDVISDDSDVSLSERNYITSTKVKTNKRKRQVSLISSGFSRKRSSVNLSEASLSQTRKLQNESTNLSKPTETTEQDFTTVILGKQTSPKASNVTPIVTSFIDIQISNRLYRVPIPYSEINSLSIRWLAEEAAKRYSRKECMKPTLELETKSGVILAEDDRVSILFPMGGTKSEEVNAKVLKWNLPPIIERYREACSTMNLEEDPTLAKLLQESSTTLDLSKHNLKSDRMGPLFRALNHQTNLVHLNLSGNFTVNDSISQFCSSLPALHNLSVLNLSSTDINSESLSLISQTFMQNENVLVNLISLDLSHSSLGDDSLQYLALITRRLKLKVLKLRDVDFTSNIFNTVTNKYLELYLDYVEDFDISYNKIDKNDIMKFLSWIRPNIIENFNVSSNFITEDGLAMEIICLFQNPEKLNVKNINLSRCRVTDSEIFELLDVLSKTDYFNKLNLSYNEEITSISLRRLFQTNTMIQHLDLVGCPNIMKYFEGNWELSNSNTLKLLELSIDSTKYKMESSNLVNMWKRKHDYSCDVVAEIPNFLKLYVT